MAVIDFSKALTGDTATMVFYAKRLLGGGETPFTKADFVDAIQARADATLPKLTPAQRFSRCMCDDEIGRLLYKVMNAAPGSSVRAPVEKADAGPRHAGPASAKMHALALDRQRSRAGSFSSAYYETYIDPRNQALREQVKSEEIQRQMSLLGTDIPSGITHTLSIGEAERMEPAKDFANVGDYSRAVARKNAEAELQKLADQRHAKHPEEKASASYAKVLTDLSNAALRRAALAVA